MRPARDRPGRREYTAALAAIVAAAGALAVPSGCGIVEDVLDPVHARAIAALGDDPSGERTGPTHRAGQPCLVCHGSAGPNHPEFSVAGTVYRTQTTAEALRGAVVTLTDAPGAMRQLDTNRTGNFYVEARAWQPVYPMRVSVSFGGVTTDMKTRVGREGACATCHTDPPGPASAGRVYLVADPATFPGPP
jgi:mono/diheme cytochrome c family protein